MSKRHTLTFIYSNNTQLVPTSNPGVNTTVLSHGVNTTDALGGEEYGIIARCTGCTILPGMDSDLFNKTKQSIEMSYIYSLICPTYITNDTTHRANGPVTNANRSIGLFNAGNARFDNYTAMVLVAEQEGMVDLTGVL